MFSNQKLVIDIWLPYDLQKKVSFKYELQPFALMTK